MSRSPTPDTHYDNDRPPQLPHIPPLPLSPRWDSLSNGSHFFLQSPKSRHAPSQNAWHEQPPQPQSQPPLAQHAALFPIRDIARIMPDLQFQHDSPLDTKASFFVDNHEPPSIGNFSRPRKLSINSTADPANLRLAFLSPSDPMLEMTNGSPLAPSWQQPRGPSVSSSISSSTFAASPSFPPAGHLPEVRTSRVRNAIALPTIGSRPSLGNSRADSMSCAPTIGGAAAPWIGGDELRSSFRSQLTSSTAPGTALTERSSVLTKDSSVSSLYANADEPSLEDVMGMYEKGFCDDDDDDDDGEEDNEDGYRGNQDKLNDQTDNRSDVVSDLELYPSTSMSGSPQKRATLDAHDVNIDPVRPLPASRSALHTEIRQSKMIFTSLAFTSTIPALSDSHSFDLSEKRDSTKTAQPEPSAESDDRNHANPNIKLVTTGTPSPSISTSCSASPFLAQLPVVEPEDPGSRDRYGFKKESQFITRKQYDTWDKGYSDYLARRRRKWVAYLKDSALMTDQPNRFPSPNAKTKRFVRKGIPPDWRGAAWFYYAGGPAILAKHAGLYDKLLRRRAKQIDIEAIERDLHRTFPDNVQFKPSPTTAGILSSTTSSERASQSTMTGSTSDGSSPGPMGLEGEPSIIASLRRVLLAFSVYNPRIGYCQSLNFIAGLLLLFVETEEQCFWLLNVVTHIYLPGTHEMSLEGSKVDLGVLMTELRDTMPSVWDKIGGELESEPVSRPTTSKSVRKSPRLRRKDTQGLSTERLPPITLCMTAWFMSCYIGTLPIETTLRVWDVFFYEGSKTLFRVALAVFKLGEPEIKAVSDPMEMFGVVQSMPRRMLDANKVLEACFKRRNGFNHLSQDVIEKRRQERRDKVRQDLLRQHGKTAAGGDVAEVGIDMPRKGILFGKRPKPKPKLAGA